MDTFHPFCTLFQKHSFQPFSTLNCYCSNYRDNDVIISLYMTTVPYTVEPPRSGHLPRPDMIFYEILTNIIYTSIGENIQPNKKQKKLAIKAGMILVHMSAQCPDLREAEILYA